ncbi:sodium- and chloride-dependent GABA transporter 2-like [Takifugu flavidus]|uniref:sodium- and chloride-dependent GABA transporter 2-like n=1 Tax=Takifugu flavidus TaxID=433684 RepID=UPI00254424E3|nr:sodium- and chloride-dependent GABA transporter 2-like [Takifugu flavidus]
MQSKAKREQWTRKREYILASAGHIVGLGNVWRFPYLCYKNGGGVFLLPYCFFAVLCGVPLFLLETVIGQYTQEGAVTCWTKICPLSEGTGYFILIIQLYSRVYTVVLAWALLYIIYCFRDPLPWATCSSPWNTDRCVDLSSVNLTTLQRENLTVNVTSGNLTKSATIEFWERGLLSMSGGIEELGKVKWELLLCLLSCWMGCYFCIWKGVRSTGKVVYFTAIFPYVMLVILLIWGLSLPGAMQGVVFYLYPDVSRLADLQVWLDACSQVLFSYGVSSGTLITFGSYNQLKNNCCRDTVWLCLLNSCTSFVAGFTVFTVLGFMAQKQDVPIGMVVDSGPGLAFIAFPQAVTMMPLPQFWAVCFFLMLMFLGLDTTFSGLETITSAVIDLFPGQMRRPWRREIFLVIFCSMLFLVQILFITEGGVYLFQLVDYYAANGTCIMFGSIIHCVAVGWAFGADKICDVLEDITGHRPWAFYKLCWRYFTPLICTVCFICSFINYQPLISSNGYEYPAWAYSLGWAMALSSIVTIPIYAIGKLCLTKGTLRQRLMVLWYPADGNNPNTEHTAKETELQHLSAPPS